MNAVTAFALHFGGIDCNIIKKERKNTFQFLSQTFVSEGQLYVSKGNYS